MEIKQAIHSSGNPHILKPRKALNKAFLKVKPNRSQIEQFKENLIQLLDRTNETESEEFHKNLVTDFLKKTYYDPNHYINTKGRNDLVIHTGNKAKSSVGVIIEAKKPTNRGEMLSREKINVKAFQELVLYYLRERITHKNLEVKYLIATNINEWFIFDANTFEKAFAQNKKLVARFMDFEGGRLAGKTTDFFYKEIAEPFIAEMQQEVEFTYFDIRNYENPLRNNNPKDDNKLIALFKLLSPEHLLKLPFTNDSNSLDKRFYGELLHIIGLTETKQGGKKLIERRKQGERNTGSFLENAIIQLDSMDKIARLENPSQFGDTQQERLFNVGLELSITWLNRILFLKLLEAQLLTYQKGDKSYEFLSLDRIHNYDDLNSLFFQVLARKYSERNEDVKALFAKVPYLNSSLFEPTDIEHSTLFISNLRDDKTLPIYSATVLKDKKGKKRSGELNALEYLFEFLNAYDFSSEGGEAIQEDNKTLINASVLGLIFEKINGYKDGSFFTPGFITMYMCRETIRKAVVQKFNEFPSASGISPEAGEPRFKTLDDVYDQIDDNKMFTRQQANDLINSLKICDPAVGSGHFLVSALNEIIAIKNDLKILQDRSGRRLKEYQVEVVNDELIVTDEDSELFEYNPTSKESQRIQEALFHEKQTIIENCLFGVDINPNSVKICRLRLWIELLKSAYYKWEDGNTSPFGGGREGELETLPNIDINIKCGNSLISRFAMDADLSKALKDSKWNIDSYRNAVDTYRNAQNKEEKREMERIIQDIKNDFRSEINANDPKVKRLQKIKGELFLLTNQTQMFEMSKKEKAAWNKKLEKLSTEANKLEAEIKEIKDNKIYENAFEWRFEFPEVLNEKGDYVGFDVVIGNPPYAVVEKKRNTPLEPYENILEYAINSHRYNAIEGGKQNLYRMFIKLAFDISKNNTGFSFIIPLTLVGDNSLFSTRNFVFNNFKDVHFHCFPQKDNSSRRVFEDAKQSTLIFLGKIDKGNSSKLENNFFVSTYPGKSFEDGHKTFSTDFNSIKQFDPQKYSIPLVDENEWAILQKIHQAPSFREIPQVKISRGEINQTIYRKYISQDSSLSRLVKGVEIAPYKFNEKLSQGVREFFDEQAYFANGKTNDHRLKRRIATQRITGVDERLRIVASLVEPIAYFADSTNSIYVEDSMSSEFILGLFNSRFFQWRFKKTSSNNNVSTTELESLPFVMEDNIAQEIEKRVALILKQKIIEPAADTSSLETEIDRLVYELYRLDEEEIAIIEGSYDK